MSTCVQLRYPAAIISDGGSNDTENHGNAHACPHGLLLYKSEKSVVAASQAAHAFSSAGSKRSVKVNDDGECCVHWPLVCFKHSGVE